MLSSCTHHWRSVVMWMVRILLLMVVVLGVDYHAFRVADTVELSCHGALCLHTCCKLSSTDRAGHGLPAGEFRLQRTSGTVIEMPVTEVLALAENRS